MKLVNKIYVGANARESLIDFETPDNFYENIVVFIHGYKGFKDWGAWNLVQDYFVSGGVAFCKFNISHNGGTINNPIDFTDLNAFANNRYTYELEDVQQVLSWLEKNVDLNDKKIHLIGHSRGGGIAVLSALDSRISSVTTWAGISDIESRFPKGDDLKKWKKEGLYTVLNSRTKQNLPHDYAFYEDWKNNKERLDIEAIASKIEIPILHIHGDNDNAVHVSESEKLSNLTNGKLFIINDASHTFNTHHPYNEKDLPNKLNEACNLTMQFISRI